MQWDDSQGVTFRKPHLLTWISPSQEDHFPGCQSEAIPAVLPGAPNFRGVPGFNVYGVGLPTVEGIKATLAHVGAAPGTSNKHGHKARSKP